MAPSMAEFPGHERPRERLTVEGAGALTDRELLAILLRTGVPGANVVDLAGSLIAQYGDLRSIASAQPEELATMAGIGPAKAAALVAAFELGRRVDASDVASSVLRGAEDIARIARSHLQGMRRERVLVLVCDGAHRVRRVAVVSDGAMDKALVPVREILNAALRHDGRAFALAHNHPSGDPDPSSADTRATADVRQAAKVVGLRFLGHVIVSQNAWAFVR